ncbi:murein transglycosylase A [Qipengyuania atrilutea]|uniref:peptidoglycan lytic exotransglycosylase n=1 Tax=Qipengyuania atrilutea TaxID=2744473 RepID=A0A850GZ36_9SPHN|nr:murein transglycosylase A [Actirhodobacter atriluteus]NVD44881.1 murein transglycosylase A [Actirhodobacter atriluteus]
MKFAKLAVLAVSTSLALSGCVRMVPETGVPPVDRSEQPEQAPTPSPVPVPAPTPPPIENARQTSLTAGPSIASLGMTEADASAALRSFAESCPKITGREDRSGLTRGASWEPACTAARTWPVDAARRFFETYFETVRVGDGAAFATGYFEPEIRGSRIRMPGYDVPVYKLPPDLERGWPEDIALTERTGRAPLGRYDENGQFNYYYDRAQIEDGALAGRGLEIAWAADPIEMFFLQIQGSGRLALPDGSVMRIGYDGQNGREYLAIGAVMRERGLIGDGPGQYAGSLQGIQQYLRERPEEGRELMRLNKSWIFFRELTGDGPLGSLGVPVRRESSVAVDPRFVPYGAPVWLELDRTVANGLWIAQDTGGAIKGANRFDTFWGAGADAREISGSMSARGRALIFLPKGSLDALTGR